MAKNALKDFIKAELGGWKKYETTGLFIVFLIIIVNAFIVKDDVISVISAFCGILYTVIAGKGKISCYIFGLMGTGCYSWLAFHNGLYGNLLLYLGCYFPMQIAGIFAWRKHLNEKTRVIEKKSLSNLERAVLTVIIICISINAIVIIKYFGGASPVFDGITTVLSIAGMYLTVKRCIEQWVIWMVVNGLSALMWLELILSGTKAYATFIMWVVYFILAIYFYRCWKTELDEKAVDVKK